MVVESKKRIATTVIPDEDYSIKLREKDKEKKSEIHAQIIKDEEAFEDRYEDEFEEEEVILHENSDNEDEETKLLEDNDESELLSRSWRPGIDPIGDDEELEYDPRVYDMYHRAMLDWSCLSFDIIPDQLGSGRSIYPHTAYVVAGTQAEKTDSNRLFMMKWKNLTKTKHRPDDASDQDSDSDDEDEEDAGEPILEFRASNHPGTVTRVRCCPQIPRLVASWSASGKVHMWDLEAHLQKLDEPGSVANPNQAPKFTFNGHEEEGYAMAFNPHKTGVFASGSCDASIRIWNPVEGGWSVEKPIISHKSSVEDIQWKKLGIGMGNIFASCSVDGSIRMFDLSTSSNKPSIIIPEAHSSDVNVISWSPFQEDLLLSGGDDGCIRVWDIRNSTEPIVHLHYHRHVITSLDWHPTDPATFAVSSLDNSVTIWDMSVEPDDQDVLHSGSETITTDSPDQLMFQHMGQIHISEIQWHPQIPGVVISTAEDGFNIFKPFNV